MSDPSISPSRTPHDDETVPSALVFLVAAGTVGASFTSGLTGFGAGILFQIYWLLLALMGVPGTGDLQRVLGILIIILGLNSLQVALPILIHKEQRHNIRWDYFFALFPGFLTMSYVGTWAVTAINSLTLKRALGLLFLVFAVYQMVIRLKSYIPKRDTTSIKIPCDPVNGMNGHVHVTTVHVDEVEHSKMNGIQNGMNGLEIESPTAEHSKMNGHMNDQSLQMESPNTDIPLVSDSSIIIPMSRMDTLKQAFLTWIRRPVIWAGLVVGVIGGFLNGAFSTGGPPQIIYFSMVPITKTQIRGTVTFLIVTQLPFRISAALLFDIWNVRDWPIYLTAPLMAVIGTALGDKMHHKVDTNTILIILQILVLLSTIGLTQPADGSPFGWIMLFVYIGIAIGIIGGVSLIVFLRYRVKKRQAMNVV